MKLLLSDKHLDRLGHHYILVMMILTRIFGSVGGLLVIYYVELTLKLPEAIQFPFRVSSLVVVILGCTLTVIVALAETSHLRRTLRRIKEGAEIDQQEARAGGKEAVTFAARHHGHEAWLVPCSTLVPVLIYLRFWHDASNVVLINITLTVFMGISIALMSTFFAVEHCMQPVIRHLLKHGVSIDYRSLPTGNLRFRLGICSTLIIMTTSLMIGTLARQRAVDIIDDPDHRDAAVLNLRTHSTYITIAAVITGVCYSSVLAGSVTKRVGALVAAMRRVGQGVLSERLQPTGNDEVDILARQFNAMIERLDEDNRTIRDLNLNLEKRVLERTDQLEKLVTELSKAQDRLTEYNKQLEVARTDAEAANKAKSQFLANISHELRTPLNGVLGMTDLLMTTKLNDQQRRFVQTARFSGTTLLDLLNEVLDISKIEAGMLETEDIVFDLRETIDPVIEATAHRCRQKALELQYFVDPAVPLRLIGDPGRLRQILSNLVNNAIKFTERGRITVRTQLLERRDTGVTVQFRVQDTGIGIPEDRFNRLFRPFSQVDASTTRNYGGTGLGLVICKQLCELMGGEISFESEYGTGSSFSFCLPFQIPEPVSNGTLSRFELLRGLPILIVSDNPTRSRSLEEQLEAWGAVPTDVACTGHSSGDPPAAVSTETPYAVAIWDWESATIPAARVTQFRALPSLKNAPFVGLTPPAESYEANQLTTLGFADHVIKPVLPSALFDAIMNALAVRDSSDLRARSGRTNSPAEETIPRTARNGVRILVAEDNEINQEVAVELLTHAGYQCDVVGDGQQALKAIECGDYHLILMDCQMPEMDGLEATRIIRERELASDSAGQRPIPIIALTANALKGEYDRCKAAGMSDYLTKPFDPIKLVATIETQLAAIDGESTHPTADANTEPRTSAGSNCQRPDDDVDASEPTVDVDSLLRRCLGKPELAKKLITKFLDRLPDDLKQIQAAIHAGDMERIASIAHMLKGAAGNLSASRIWESAAQLESLGRRGDPAGIEEGWPRFQQDVTQFLCDLPGLSARLSPHAKVGDVQCVS